MALNVGSRLGHCDVTALIGEGGMGQVYQATDTKLNRQVALKILPEAFATDPDRLARFQREAQVLASLNHPNIAAIHGLEDSEDTKALVLELVEGPTLADRIAHGPIPIDEALPIAKQIAEALEAAHEAGVIHRDLKPANIKVKDDGTVKVLDFGLAKALDTTPEGDPSQSPTLTAAATQMGVIMGTAAYMSPEQARGKTIDRRADIWSFGVVLFEMLTGRRPFEGRDVSEVLAGVIRAEPAWDVLADTPPHLNMLLKRCLEKEPRQRVQAAGDVRLAMEGAFETAASVSAAEPSGSQTVGWHQALPWAVGTLVVGSIITGVAVWRLARPAPVPPAPTMRFDMSSSTEPLVLAGLLPDLAISPDGMHLVYVSGPGRGAGRTRFEGSALVVRSLGELTSRALEATAPLTAVSPFVSADNAWVGFLDLESGTLQRVSILGGPAVRICALPEGAINLEGASWGVDDTIIFGTFPGRG